MNERTPLVDAAEAYLTAGLKIIALSGKKPNNEFHRHGLSEPLAGAPDTLDDLKLISRVFTHPTTTGVGILIPKDVLVADVDSRDAAVLFKDLGGDMDSGAVAATRNGLHLWYYRFGAEASVWLGGRTLLFRGYGSYVAAPPSAHPDGGTYTWLVPLKLDGVQSVAASLPRLPIQMEELLRVQEAQNALTVRTTKITLWELSYEDGVFSLKTSVVDPEIEPLAKAVAGGAVGNRNNLLAWAAMTAAEEGIPLEVALPALLEASLKAGLGSDEARVTIKAAYRRKG